MKWVERADEASDKAARERLLQSNEMRDPRQSGGEWWISGEKVVERGKHTRSTGREIVVHPPTRPLHVDGQK